MLQMTQKSFWLYFKTLPLIAVGFVLKCIWPAPVQFKLWIGDLGIETELDAKLGN